jgi:hypothetical protein
MAVETFFMLSGLLTAYVPLMDFNKGRKFNIVKYYVYRYVRQVEMKFYFLVYGSDFSTGLQCPMLL